MKDFNREHEMLGRLETDYLRILYYEFPEKFVGVYKSYEYTRLCTILEGEKTVFINNGDSLNYNSGEFLLMPQESYVNMLINTPTKALVFELNDTLIKKVSENVSMDFKIDYDVLIGDKFLFSKLSPQLKNTVAKISKMMSSNERDTKYILDILAQELVYYLIKIKGTNQVLSYEIANPINQAIKLMKEEYMSPISIKKVANELGMSEANFSQYFKKIIGISPKAYLTHLKMEKAKEIIEHQSVTDVAFDLGYENISNFINAFRKTYGITPKQYQMKIS